LLVGLRVVERVEHKHTEEDKLMICVVGVWA